MTSSSDGYCNCHIYSYGYDSAARLSSLTGWFVSNGEYMQNIQYNAAGQIISDTLGDGETETYTYDKRLRLQSASVTYNNATIYSFNIGSFAPDGDVLAVTDSVNGSWTYTYDQLNRLVGANQNNGAAVYSYVYDRFGNRWQQNGPQSYLATFTGNDPGSPANNNRIDGYCYDAAGNLLLTTTCPTGSFTPAYTYDAENRIVSVEGSPTPTYTYDARGYRVLDDGILDCNGIPGMGYLYDLQGRAVADVATDYHGGGVCDHQLYVGSRYLHYTHGQPFFNHQDWLGTNRARVSDNPSYQDNCASLPFGDALQCTDTPSEYRPPIYFTGKQRDFETNLDYFGARYYASSFGRFISPDPAGMMAVDIGSPQTLNRYSYVLNNPLSFTDPFGLDCAYLNNSGTGIEKGGIDQNSSSGECGKTGGYWVNGTITQVNIDSNATTISLTGTTNGTNQTSASYQEDAVVTVGEYNNIAAQTYNHIALGLFAQTQFGQNPRSDLHFAWALSMHGPTATVPGAIKPQVGGRLLGTVRIRATGMQAQMLQDAIHRSAQNPPPYTLFGQTGCDCGTWAQMMLGDAGINAGPPAPLPDVLMQQLNQLYPQQQPQQ